MFISDMKYAFFPLVLLVFGCLACKGKRKAASGAVVDSVELTQMVPKVESAAADSGFDPSMENLHSFETISLEALLCQKWAFEDADKTHWNEIFWDPIKDVRQYPELELFTDHQAILNPRCKVQMGNWSVNKKTRELRIRMTDGSSRIYVVRQMALKQLELGWEKDGGEAVIRLKADGIVQKEAEADPYHPANNRWRMKPRAAETQEQLKKRIRGCVHFFALFFADNHNRHASDISFEGLPSCFIWYNGGIGMQARASLDKKWIDCFYSESQANSAYDLIAAELERHNLKWPEHPTSWVEQTGQVLGQLERKF